jgi:hypothetical protein
MCSITKKYAAVLGIVASLVSVAALAEEPTGDEVCQKVWNSNIGAPADEFYLAAYGYVQGTYDKLESPTCGSKAGPTRCNDRGAMACGDAKGGGCKLLNTHDKLFADPNIGAEVIGFSKAGAGYVEYIDIPKMDAGHNRKARVTPVVCNKNKALFPIRVIARRGVPAFVEQGEQLKERLKRTVVLCAVTKIGDKEDQVVSGIYGPEIGLLDPKMNKIPYPSLRGGFYYPYDVGQTSYKIRFLGLIEVADDPNDSEGGNVTENQKNCERLKEKLDGQNNNVGGVAQPVEMLKAPGIFNLVYPPNAKKKPR